MTKKEGEDKKKDDSEEEEEEETPGLLFVIKIFNFSSIGVLQKYFRGR